MEFKNRNQGGKARMKILRGILGGIVLAAVYEKTLEKK
jgi:hypothetical protein